MLIGHRDSSHIVCSYSPLMPLGQRCSIAHLLTFSYLLLEKCWRSQPIWHSQGNIFAGKQMMDIDIVEQTCLVSCWQPTFSAFSQG